MKIQEKLNLKLKLKHLYFEILQTKYDHLTIHSSLIN